MYPDSTRKKRLHFLAVHFLAVHFLAEESGEDPFKIAHAALHARVWRKLKSCTVCRNGFDMVQSQPLRSSFKLITSFTFSSLFKSSDSERLDKFLEVLVEFFFLVVPS